MALMRSELKFQSSSDFYRVVAGDKYCEKIATVFMLMNIIKRVYKIFFTLLHCQNILQAYQWTQRWSSIEVLKIQFTNLELLPNDSFFFYYIPQALQIRI